MKLQAIRALREQGRCPYVKVIDDALIEIMCEPLNATMVRLRVRVNGTLYNATIKSGILSLSEPRPYNHTFEYLVDVRTNYAWMNGVFVGFFPLYIFPPLGYDNVTRIATKLVFMNEPLRVPTEGGKPLPPHVHFKLSNGTEVTVISLWLRNQYLDLIFVYHYPIEVECVLPLGNGLYAHIEAQIDESWIPYILSIDDYPPWASCWDLRLLSLLIFIGACVAGLLAAAIKRRRARGR